MIIQGTSNIKRLVLFTLYSYTPVNLLYRPRCNTTAIVPTMILKCMNMVMILMILTDNIHVVAKVAMKTGTHMAPDIISMETRHSVTMSS